MELFQSSPNLEAMTGKKNYIGRRFHMNEPIGGAGGGGGDHKRYISTEFYIYDGSANRNLEKVYRELKEIYIFLMKKYNCRVSINKVYIILSPDKKYTTFDENGGDVNSAYYVPSKKELAVYKDEEFHLRFIHEVMHHILGEDECDIPTVGAVGGADGTHPIFQSEEFSLLEICTEYHAMKNYLELNHGININGILEKRRRYIKYLSSIKNETILARFLRYFIFPAEMLAQEMGGGGDDSGRGAINYDLIYRKLTDKLREPAKYKNGLVYVKFL
jgi:hypothetical protein